MSFILASVAVILLITGVSRASSIGEQAIFIWLSGILACICIAAAVYIENLKKQNKKPETEEDTEAP
ncbi:hypothetical protein A2662_00260 [Candidatus Giovannonibacteria bacterium RIFCSPHIGHO2_01_FULL_45_33]|uniref:Uncharacterized protein n=1 Tax=Candidatus Giovannonibacteria bacterium RIFCSPLOWO2_01_FULL_45_34 TaxID=1798351 RepID=A0A1F5X0U0_9BACT|nr:MAG: hypothetical protein A2662_00260 [Candidatus Giovannonibacteria bacterium RIFCSPHIGHO2_01_FULL_45_33]OGF70738.1 MAG: hypothetical protein A3C73_03140 [Candidatus Giovannonibacteria bacterium RIFCSPHIGHO2_02_FULL_44_11]OGF81473.1 MAG: hypothetical protein A2930_04485 [Candidatus Giovannonibacteria bacterium RIFCSPLOWO2_01_FULL_45_34]